MKKLYAFFLLGFFPYFTFAQTIELEQYATGFLSPVDITNAGDDRLFVVERSGRIKIIDENAIVISTPFLDIDNLVTQTSGQNEQGLLGLAFHPDYINNGYFFSGMGFDLRKFDWMFTKNYKYKKLQTFLLPITPRRIWKRYQFSIFK